MTLPWMPLSPMTKLLELCTDPMLVSIPESVVDSADHVSLQEGSMSIQDTNRAKSEAVLEPADLKIPEAVKEMKGITSQPFSSEDHSSMNGEKPTPTEEPVEKLDQIEEISFDGMFHIDEILGFAGGYEDGVGSGYHIPTFGSNLEHDAMFWSLDQMDYGFPDLRFLDPNFLSDL